MSALIPRLLFAGVSSHVGKTSVTTAVARAFSRRGLRVATFKCGPDYLDPTYHARAAHSTCHNLDGWMMGREGVSATFLEAARGADIALIEGVMGLYDGASPQGEQGSSAEIAKWLSAPVVLVCDASGMARSIAALVHGYASFDGDVPLAGVICNRVGSRSHLTLLREALGPAYRYVAGLPRAQKHAFPERHLGLRTAEEDAISDATFEAWADLAEEWLDLDALLELARSAPPLDASVKPLADSKVAQPRVRLGIARDEAFHFYYPYNLSLLESLGVELVPFSPIHDRALPEVHGLYLGGGYPEVHAQALAANRELRAEILAFSRKNHPIYAECGGLMYLSSSIRTLSGSEHEMVGVLPGQAVMAESLRAIGYVDVETSADSLLGPAGTRYRGHQFRYSELTVAPEVERAFNLQRRRGAVQEREGYVVGRTLATYVHAHWASNPEVPRALVRALRDAT